MPTRVDIDTVDKDGRRTGEGDLRCVFRGADEGERRSYIVNVEFVDQLGNDSARVFPVGARVDVENVDLHLTIVRFAGGSHIGGCHRRSVEV